ncbi:MAG: DUF1559 domain-containing protein [Planctomycetaceae bacterium]|nr:DUF1559 domain-containing protein [Planctomycetaceae bacterium]
MARVTESRNNLKQIGLAAHNYHDVYRVLPPGGTFAEDGTPHHSWQTRLLPYLDSSPLYSKIDFDRPWTAPTNEEPFSTDYPIFLNPCEPHPEPINGYAASQYAGNSQLLRRNGELAIPDIRDGTSNTVLAGEVGSGFKAWGDPTNTRDPSAGIGQSAEQFGSSVLPRVMFLMVDGSVRATSPNIDPKILKAISTPDGHEDISDESW